MAPRGVLAAAASCIAAVITASAAPSRPADATSRGLFADQRTFTFSLEAPLEQLFERSKADPDATVEGRISYTDDTGRAVVIDRVELSVRGHTSRREDECPFPKLKVQLKKADGVEHTAFAGIPTLKIGTHCGDNAEDTLTAKYGRLANEHTAHREAFVYRLLNVMHVPSLDSRPARITYIDGDSRIERDAMLLEDLDVAVRRLGGSGTVPEEKFHDARRDFAPADAVAIAFGEALIGNFDWCLKFFPEDRYRCDARHPLWNIAAIVGDGGRLTPLMYDFDIAGMVTGHHRWFKEVFGEGLDPAASEAATEVTAQVQRARSLFPRVELDAARDRLRARRAAAFDALTDAVIDPAGREIARNYLTAFFDAIDHDEAFYRPVVVKSGATAYIDGGGRKPACGARSVVPVGTPVSDPLATNGSLVRVRLLDALWRWAPPSGCDAVHHPIWIDSRAIDTNYP